VARIVQGVDGFSSQSPTLRWLAFRLRRQT
jgi:hypothetical protein